MSTVRVQCTLAGQLTSTVTDFSFCEWIISCSYSLQLFQFWWCVHGKVLVRARGFVRVCDILLFSSFSGLLYSFVARHVSVGVSTLT